MIPGISNSKYKESIKFNEALCVLCQWYKETICELDGEQKKKFHRCSKFLKREEKK